MNGGEFEPKELPLFVLFYLILGTPRTIIHTIPPLIRSSDYKHVQTVVPQHGANTTRVAVRKEEIVELLRKTFR